MKTPIISTTLALLAVATGFGGQLFGSEADDKKIEQSFDASYVNKTYLKDDSVKTVAKDGIVTLTGTVNYESHRDLAEQTASGLPGVTRVDNKLEVKDKSETNSDNWIARKVEMSLLFHCNVSAGNTDVDVKDGVATLTGTANSQAQKDLTGAYAKDVDGVTEVNNLLVVKKGDATHERWTGESIDDASINAQVKMALMTQRSTRAANAKVETKNRVVTVSGIAANEVEKSSVTNVISDIKGVSSVNNLMTVGTVSARGSVPAK